MAFNRAQLLLVAFTLGLLLMSHSAEAYHGFCHSISKTYKKICTDKEDCSKACIRENFYDGFCSDIEIDHHVCVCRTECMNALPPQYNIPELAPSKGPSEAKVMPTRKVSIGMYN
ncbi:defensin J1-1-like [Triticum urartu]|uniref:Knottins-like domain-containing protein n=1 Tax=Triticum urartu TaxID=4572 RepID=A0A8R7U1Y0_TRIUA|nr:defensin J1-1-like [Triticum urartu]